MEENLNIAAY